MTVKNVTEFINEPSQAFAKKNIPFSIFACKSIRLGTNPIYVIPANAAK